MVGQCSGGGSVADGEAVGVLWGQCGGGTVWWGGHQRNFIAKSTKVKEIKQATYFSLFSQFCSFLRMIETK